MKTVRKYNKFEKPLIVLFILLSGAFLFPIFEIAMNSLKGRFFLLQMILLVCQQKKPLSAC